MKAHALPLLLVLLASTTARAESCAPIENKQLFRLAREVFFGSITKTEKPRDQEVNVTFKVEKSYKGKAKDTLVAHYGDKFGENDLRKGFPVGGKYVVFAFQNESGKGYSIDGCGASIVPESTAKTEGLFTEIPVWVKQSSLNQAEVSKRLKDAHAQIESGKRKKAIESLESFFTSDTEDDRRRFLLAWAYGLEKRYDDAIALNKELAQWSKTWRAAASFNNACLYALKGDKKEAIYAVEDTVSYLKDDDNDGEIEKFTKRLETDPDLKSIRGTKQFKAAMKRLAN